MERKTNEALGPEKEDQEQNEKSDGIPVPGRQHAAGKGFGDAQDHSSQDSAEDASQTANNRGAKSFQPQHGAHVVDAHGNGGDHDAGRGAQGGAETEGKLHHLAHPDAHQAGCDGIERGGPHGFTQQGKTEKNLQTGHEQLTSDQ